MLELFLYILSLLPPAVVAFIAGYLAGDASEFISSKLENR